MINCLSLLHQTHVRSGHMGKASITACGISIADEHAGEGLFAGDPRSATCISCRSAAQRASIDPASPPSDPGKFARWFFAEVLNGNDAELLAKVTHPRFAPHFPAKRLTRLHELFADWMAEIDELLADRNSMLVRYAARCTDQYGLLGPVGPARQGNQAVILRLQDGLLIGVDAIVDDFALWGASGKRAAGAGS